MHLEILLEEPSAEVVVAALVPKILGTKCTFATHPHQGKTDLLGKLPSRLRAYSRWLPEDWRVLVLIDSDNSDCRALKQEMERIAIQAGLSTRMSVGEDARFQVLIRLAIEELEAWFFGDIAALCAAYPGVPLSLGRRSGYRDPDAIRGGTWEALEQVLQRAGYHRAGLAKIAAARDISQCMDPERNRSRSFQVFRQGLLSLAGR